MKAGKIAIFSIALASLTMVGCSSMNNTGKGALLGAGGGAALGAGVGALFGGGKGALIGAAVGGGVGAGTGAVIGNKMDKQKAELQRIENAKVEEIKDVNGLKAIKITFDSGILFASGKSDLSPSAKSALTQFAQSIENNPGTDIAIYGHTDNTGGISINQPLSENRALAVSTFLRSKGIASSRMTTKGMADSSPVADNSTPAGRLQNRRVEVFITASADMIKRAEAGTL